MRRKPLGPSPTHPPQEMPHSGQAGVNQLGGIFVNGRPLPPGVRARIVELAELGVRPCDISRQLLVSHGCVSKILSRYHETGSVSPGAIGGHKTRVRTHSEAQLLPPLIQWKIAQWREERPFLSAKEIRDLLISFRLYEEEVAPSLAHLNKLLKTFPPEDNPTLHLRPQLSSQLVVPRPIKPPPPTHLPFHLN